MSPLQDFSPFHTSDTSNTTSSMAQDKQGTLPGLKRGVAIGITCSAAIILILLVVLFVITRQKRLGKRKQQKQDKFANKIVFEEVWWQEKTTKLTQSPTHPPKGMETSDIQGHNGSREAERHPSRISTQIAPHENCYPLSQTPDHPRKPASSLSFFKVSSYKHYPRTAA